MGWRGVRHMYSQEMEVTRGGLAASLISLANCSIQQLVMLTQPIDQNVVCTSCSEQIPMIMVTIVVSACVRACVRVRGLALATHLCDTLDELHIHLCLNARVALVVGTVEDDGCLLLNVKPGPSPQG